MKILIPIISVLTVALILSFAPACKAEPEPQELFQACRAGNLEKVERLLDKGADINAIDNIGKSALIWAAEKGHTDVAQLLIDRGADIFIEDTYGITAFMRAAYFGHTDTENLLKEKGACDIPGQTPSLTIEIARHIVYAGVDGIPTSLDVYSPSQKGPWPVVIVVHGTKEDRHDYTDLARAIASQGAVVFNIDLLLCIPIQGAVEREACAVRFARATAPDYGGDPSRIIIAGHSAAAVIGLAVGLVGDNFKGDCVIGKGSAIPDALVGYEGPFDFMTTSYLGFEVENQEDFVDPYSYIGQNPGLQIRLINGDYIDAQNNTRTEVAIAMHQTLLDAGYDVELFIVEGVSHISLSSPDNDAFALMVKEVVELANEL